MGAGRGVGNDHAVAEELVHEGRLAAAGATRGSLSGGDDIKSVVTIFGTEEQLRNSSACLTDYMLDTCKISEQSEPRIVLGGLHCPIHKGRRPPQRD